MSKRSLYLRLACGGIGVMLLTSAYHRLTSSSLMAEAANRFLAALTPEQRAKATFAFEEDERQNWHFVPIERKGSGAARDDVRAEASGHGASQRGAQPAGLLQGGIGHEPGGRTARHRTRHRSRARSREILRIHIRHAFRRRHMGLSRGRPSPQPKLYRGGRARGGRAQFLRRQSRGGQRRSAQRIAGAGRRGRSRARRDSVARSRAAQGGDRR